MSSVSIQDFDLVHLDMAFAISQDNLNSGLYTYLASLPEPQLSWGFDIQNKVLVPPRNPASPAYAFTGSISAPGDGVTPVLDLSGSSAANQVAFNLTFSSATFTDNLTGSTYTQGATQWVLPFGATLSQIVPGTEAGTPQWLQSRIAALTGQYGNVFDLNQVLIDLTGLTIGSTATQLVPDDFGAAGMGDWFLMLEGMAKYVSANAATLFPALPSPGFAVVHNGTPPTAALPTYTPTAAQFVIVPSTTAGYSALVWALMINGDPMPATPSEEFTSVTFFSDDDTPGLAVIRSGRFLAFVQSELAATTDALGAAQYVEAVESDGDVTWQEAVLGSPGGLSTATPTAANQAQIASWTMPTQSTSADAAHFGAPTDYSYATSDSTLSVNFVQYRVSGFYDQLSVSGTISFYVAFTSTGSRSSADWTSPTFQYDWNAAFSIEPDNGTGGGVQFVYDPDASSFPTTPTIVGNSQASGTVPPDTQDLLTNLLATPISDLEANLKQGVVAEIGGLGDFVFPGGGTFAFQGAAVSTLFALYTTIQYQNPTA